MDPTENPEAESPETDEPEGEEPEAGAAPEDVTPVDRPSKRERRAERAAEHNARKEAAELREQLRQEGERRATLEASVAEMRGYLQARDRQSNDGQDEASKEITRLNKEAKRRLEAAGAAKTQEGVDAEMAAYHEAIAEAAAVRTQKKLAGEFERLRQSQPNTEMLATQHRLSQEYPWFMQDRHATLLAGSLEQEMLSQGKPRTEATTKAALAEAARRLGIGGHAAPSQQSRSAYSGIPSREGSPANGGEGKVTVNAANLEKWQQKLAEKAYPTDEAPDAHKKWAALMNKHFRSQSAT